MNRFMLSQNRVYSRAINMKVTLTLRHCKPDGDGSLGIYIYIYIYLGQLTWLLAYLFTDLLFTYLLHGTQSFLRS